MMESVERARGALAGCILGDSLAVPTRSMSPEQVMAVHGLITGLGDADSEHPHYSGARAGSVSELTEQMMIFGQNLAETGEVHTAGLASELLTWDNERPGERRGLDAEHRTSLERVLAGEEPGRFRTSMADEAVWAVPLAIAHSSLDYQEALEADVGRLCRVGRYTARTVEGANLIAHVVSAVICGEQIGDAIDGGLAEVASQEPRGHWTGEASVVARVLYGLEWSENLRDIELLAHVQSIVGGSRAAGEAVPAALILAKAFAGRPFEGLCAISQLGGESTLIASIAGAILGGDAGESAFPKDTLRMLDVWDKGRIMADRLLVMSGRDSKVCGTL